MAQQPDYWFKRKTYGWGWTPANGKGWAVLLLLLAGTMGPIFFIPDWVTGHTSLYIAYTFFIAVLAGIICYKKGEKPKWSWGKKDN